MCCAPAFGSTVAAAGFEHLPGGAATFEELFVGAPPPSDPEHWRWARVAFATRAVEAMLPDLQRHIERWRPDLIVRETTEFAGCLAAERAGLPHASVATGSWSSRDDRRAGVADVLDRWRRRLGLAPDPSAEMMYRYLTLGFTPQRWDGAGVHPPTAHFIRYEHPRAREEPHPPWLDQPRDRPLVLASLGECQLW